MNSVTSPSAHRIVCVGRFYVDLIFAGLPSLPALGREHYAETLSIVPGGGAYNTAAHLAGLGCRARLAAAIGEDAFSQSVLPAVEASGVDLSLLERFDSEAPQLTAALSVGDDRAFVSHRRGPAAPADLAARLAAAPCEHLHIAELATLVEAPWLVEAARNAGATVSLDISWDDAALAQGMAVLARHPVDLLLPNLEEMAALTGEADERAGLAALAAVAERVAVKRGPRGAAYLGPEGQFETAAIPARTVDATGAGDAFNAGFLQAMLGGGTPEQSLRQGTICGSHAVSRAGGASDVLDHAGMTARMAAPDELAGSPPASPGKT